MLNSINLLAVEAGQIVLWVLIGLLLVAMIVMPMFSNRKRQKEVNEMLNTIDVGDEIMTLGGIMGTVVALYTHESGEKLMTIETGEGEKKSTMTFTIQALRLNYTKTKQRQAALAAQKQAELEAKANKSSNEEKAESDKEQSAESPEINEEKPVVEANSIDVGSDANADAAINNNDQNK